MEVELLLLLPVHTPLLLLNVNVYSSTLYNMWTRRLTFMLGTKPGSILNRCPSSLVMKAFSSSYDLSMVVLQAVAV